MAKAKNSFAIGDRIELPALDSWGMEWANQAAYIKERISSWEARFRRRL